MASMARSPPRAQGGPGSALVVLRRDLARLLEGFETDLDRAFWIDLSPGVGQLVRAEERHISRWPVRPLTCPR